MVVMIPTYDWMNALSVLSLPISFIGSKPHHSDAQTKVPTRTHWAAEHRRMNMLLFVSTDPAGVGSGALVHECERECVSANVSGFEFVVFARARSRLGLVGRSRHAPVQPSGPADHNMAP